MPNKTFFSWGLTFANLASFLLLPVALASAADKAATTLPSAANLVLTWQDCLKLLKQNNKTLLAARETLTSSQQLRKASQSDYLPKAQLSANSIFASSKESAKGNSATLSLSENLFAGGSTQAAIAQAEANLQLNEANLKATQVDLLLQLQSAYAELLLAQKSKNLITDIVRRREENFAIVKLRYTNGKENKGSLLLAEAYLKEAEFTKLKNENDIRTVQQKLQALIEAPTSNFTLADDYKVNLPSHIDDFKNLISNHPEHQKAQAQQQISAALLAVAKAGFYPSLSLQYNNTTYQAQDKSQTSANSNSWNAGVYLSWNLFDGGKDYYTVQSRITQNHANEMQIIAVDQSILSQLMLAQSQYIEAREKNKVDAAFLAASVVREQIARNKYNNGLATFDDWDLIESDLINRQRAQLQSDYNVIISEANFKKAIGQGVLE